MIIFLLQILCYYYYYYCCFSDESLSVDQWEAVSSKTRVANESSLTKRSVSRIISHPGVKYEKLRYFNDTVLVQLSEPYDLSEEVNTICLPEQAVDNKQPCVTASWSYESPGGKFEKIDYVIVLRAVLQLHLFHKQCVPRLCGYHCWLTILSL